MKLNALQFPPRRENFKGSVAPVWCEPMVGSGERICCGVAVISGVHTLVVAAPGFERFAAVYKPEGADFLTKCAVTVLEELRFYIAREKSFPEVALGIGGYTVGEPMSTTGNTLGEMAVAGLMMRSSLCTREELEALK